MSIFRIRVVQDPTTRDPCTFFRSVAQASFPKENVKKIVHSEKICTQRSEHSSLFHASSPPTSTPCSYIYFSLHLLTNCAALIHIVQENRRDH
uniref:Uncharacterized protein n=1 Tax=Arundo donax TaxID=35708 RepID=A0A0A8YT86_ARUDO